MNRRCVLSALRSFLVTLAFVFTGTLFLSLASRAQESSQPASQTSPLAPAESETGGKLMVPSGTRLHLVLTRPIDSKSTHRGDEIDTQITAPVTIGNRAIVPAGTYLQGKVEKLNRKGNRAEFLMQSGSIIFPDGYVANVAGPLTIESDEDTAWRNPSGTTKAGVIAAPAAGVGLGALIGNAAHTTHTTTFAGTTLTSSSPTGIAVGSIVGLAAGGAVALVLLARSHQFFVDVGAPMELTLAQPLVLASNQVEDAVKQSQSQPPAITPVAKRPVPPTQTASPLPADHGTCYTPDTPGTPPTVIPGIPATPNSPGTPDVVIPGSPSIPGTPYPCP
ncbi:MAG: hypothetical protein JOZ80_10895 [Acidobacteriaceae bacterium]|nr:hypothetical protein [Acidobacteriaceae bacterium]